MAKKAEKSFYLHSFRNRHLYPASDYPLTHLLDRLNITRYISKQSSYVEHFLYAFILLLICTFIGTLLFRLHIQIYNTIFGPFHFNQEQFVEYINKYQYEKDQSFFFRFSLKIEYIQVEVNENNIQNSQNTYDTIRQFSDPRSRRHHIATYKRIKRPAIYVKLPTHSQKHFHAYHPIHLPSYSIRTLQCIVRNVPFGSITTYRTWIEKSDYVQFIKQEYTKNATAFNRAVLTKCGILIGHLYRPMHEKAFTSTTKHQFTEFNLALDMTQEYYPFYSFLIGGLIFTWLFLKSLFYLILYLTNIIRCKIFHRLGIFSFALEVLPDVMEELWLLNLNGFPHEQLLNLDKLIQTSECKFTKNLFIIENANRQLFVVIIKVHVHEKLNVHDESLPFLICPVTDIQKVTQYGGICYGKDASWIRWPAMKTNEQSYAEWLHDQLMELSSVYKQRYNERLQNEREDALPSYFTGRVSGSGFTQRRKGRPQRSRINSTFGHSGQLVDLIREENNIQRLRIERQNIIENIENLRQPISPATARFIAKFRQENEHNKKVADTDMTKKQMECTLCQEELELNNHYAVWPCDGAHAFHYDCMLKSLRMRNTCPNCRHEVEGVPTTSIQAVLGRFLSRVLT